MTLELKFSVPMSCGGGYRPNGGRISLTEGCMVVTSRDNLRLEHVAYFTKPAHGIRRIGELSVVISDGCDDINLDQLMDAAAQLWLVR